MSGYTYQTSKVTRSSQAMEDSKKKTSLLKDGSWIKKYEEEDEDVDRDPNFGRSVLSRYKTSETVESPDGNEVKTTKTISTTTSVDALSRRFSASREEPKSSTLPSSTSTSTYTRRTSAVTEEPKTSTTTTTISKGGKTTETTITTSQSLRSPVIKSPTKTETFTERVQSSSKGPLYSNYTPTKTTKLTEPTVSTNKDAEEKLYDTLLPSVIKDDYSPTESKRTISTTETVIVRSSNDIDAEDQLYSTLIPSAIKGNVSDRGSSISKSKTVTVESSRGGDSPTLSSPSFTGRLSSYKVYSDDNPSTRSTSYTVSTKPSDEYSSDQKSYSRTDSSYEYSSITSPTTYSSSSYRSSSRSDENPDYSTYSKSSTKSVYGSSDRTVLEKDLCTSCRKPFTGDAKMVLDDMKINCHATCFKCEVCNCTLGNMKAGDNIWIYKRMVHCENCFEVTREKWRR